MFIQLIAGDIMQTRSFNNFSQRATTLDTHSYFTGAGCISELCYDPRKPHLFNLLVMPMLKQLGQQARWQLWLTPTYKLSRNWLQQLGVPLEKTMQATLNGEIKDYQTMLRALRSRNFSVVLAWIEQDLTTEQLFELEKAAQQGHSIGFIMRTTNQYSMSAGQENRLKIHSTRLH